jgi:hypothetical protein
MSAHTDLSRVPVSVAPSPATSGTSVGVTDANAAYLPNIYPWWGVLVPVSTAPTRANAEIVKVTAGSSSGGTTTYTITRAQGNPVTTAQTVTTSFDLYEAINSQDIIDIEYASFSLFKQALINSSFDVWQRNTTFTYNDDTFGPDRWNLLTETNGAWTCTRDTDVPAALGFKYSAKFTNVTLNNQCALVQILENVDSIKLDDQTVSLSFYAKTSGTEIANLRATVLSWSSTVDVVTSDVIGTWASDGTDPTWATNLTAEVAGVNKALTSSWQRFTIENVAIDTASMANIAVVIWVDDGTIAANDDFWITGIQLEVGATAHPYQPKTFFQEINDCKRYYRKSYLLSRFAGDTTDLAGAIVARHVTTGAGEVCPVYFDSEMRTTPTVTLYNPVTGESGKVRDDAASTAAAPSGDLCSKGWSGLNTGFTADHQILYQFVASAEM